ncbi:hypothetical protein BT96DRAFT_1007911 [Gymnopus androsaceus JB14]|uniref:Uncharacterized protein n=1 Tax=Gymnopus androsaceus JB14 TaxID=1447944 RepID=A0A6A4GGU3_9AGAR|nr:hypothetical protein BT96DRAFT_1007911 [Gymnopus androsaceus JB14]
MADSQQSPAPLTDSLRSDVLLLSTQLSGKQSTSSESHPTDMELSLFVDISTLLAIGHSHSPDAKNDDTQVRALKGQLKNKPPQGRKEKDMDAPSAPIAGKNKEQSAKSAEDIVHLDVIIPMAENGRKLLDKWDDKQEPNKESVQSNNDFPFGAHLQDLFDVIASLRRPESSDQSSDLLPFQLFIHHRAYRKLGWRVLLFSTHWGKSPFDIISDCLPDPNLKSESFQFPGGSSPFHDTLARYVPPESTQSGDVYLVNSNNAARWLALFKSAWAKLQSHLLVKESDGKNPKVRRIVAIMVTLERLIDVFKHLLSANGVAQALAKAELAQYHNRVQSPIEPNTAISENDEDDDDELELPSQSTDFFNLIQNPQQAVVRLLQGLKTVLAWQTSSRHIHQKATYFGQLVDGKLVKFRLSRFCYHKDVLQSTAFDVDAVLPLLREWQAPSDNPYTRQQAESIIHRTLNAKVHAEAALMDWITTLKEGDNTHQDWPIGVSKKCCQLCTHGTFYPWLPPPGIPDSILLELRNELLAACKTMVAGHSRHSSASSATSHVDTDLHHWETAFNRYMMNALNNRLLGLGHV